MHGERDQKVHAPGDVSLVRIDLAARALGTDTRGVRTLIEAGELVGFELVHVPSLVALQRRLSESAPAEVAA